MGLSKGGHLESVVCQEEEPELAHATLLLCLSHSISYLADLVRTEKLEKKTNSYRVGKCWGGFRYLLGVI